MADEHPLNWNSRNLTHGWQRGVNAFFWGLGFKPEDFDKAQIGIGTPLLDGNICNVHAHELAKLIAQGCADAGLIGFPFGVSPVSDNITQGNIGGAASLCSRNLMANGAEMICTSHGYDAIIGLHHCDKNGPAFAMALARTNYPGLIVNGGSIMPGCHKGHSTSILDVYDAAAKEKQGTMSYEESEQIIRTACPGAGGCGIAASFNTWGIALEAMGLSLPDTSSMPAIEAGKRSECLRVGQAVRHLLEKNIRPRDIITKASLTNAMTAIAAVGGSTNGVLHILAVAREAGVDFNLRDVQAICRKTPVLCNFAPRGRGTMNDLHRLGGTTMLLKHLFATGLLDGSCITADIQICFGNIAPHGMVFKVSSLDEPRFEGTAICFNDSKGVSDAAAAGRIRPGHIVVIRGCGPVGLGMPEMHVASAALAVPELYGKVALLSDTRVSGVSGGAVGVHCSPEAAVGGPIARVQDGDVIEFDLLAGTIEVKADLDARPLTILPVTHPFGYLADFAATVTQAHEGCVPRWVVSRA
ncbi:MAG: dihydroxy-acid dehydratase [Verrucomicrobiaceae bacterium]|nr:dihydroxy-acid dehydratase [Verrucomicrobiaceae bacterium]